MRNEKSFGADAWAQLPAFAFVNHLLRARTRPLRLGPKRGRCLTEGQPLPAPR